MHRHRDTNALCHCAEVALRHPDLERLIFCHVGYLSTLFANDRWRPDRLFFAPGKSKKSQLPLFYTLGAHFCLFPDNAFSFAGRLACWIMILPLFLLAASIGGLIGGYFKLKKKDTKVYISILTLFPFFIAPVENRVGAIPGTYEAYTYIDIHAPADKIWDNITRVETISREQDKGWLTRLLGMPRPVEAVLNYKGVGASREAKFTKGLVFHEQVSEYTDKRKMVFSIKAYPFEIPSTTMDEHILIGGKYFDVLNGAYELEQLDTNTYRLHLYSHFRLTTTFNFYASWWARWIMKDIQNNILQIEKERAERG